MAGHERAVKREERVSDVDQAAVGAQPQAIDLLIHGGFVMTMDGEDRVIEDGAVAVAADRIVAIGDLADLERRYAPARRLGGRHTIVMPGLVDAYAHAGHGMIKAVYDPHLGWPASEIYFRASTPDWWEADALLTGLERLVFGVTTGHSTLGATPARADDPVYAEAHVRGVGQIGTRDVLGMGPPDPFFGHLPKPWKAIDWRSGQPVEVPFTYDHCMDVSADVVTRFNGAHDGRISVCLAIPYLCGMSPTTMTGSHHYRYSPEDIQEVVRRGREAQAFANEHGVLIHTHAARGSFEHLERKAGRTEVEALLGPNVVIAHGHGLTLADIDLVAGSSAAVVWVPFGSWGTKVGPAPVPELVRAGVRTCIATDGAAPFHVSDLFVDVHRAMFLIAEHYHDGSLLPAGKALRMITIEAAAVLGMDDEIGSLEVGKKADVIVIDGDQPHLTPFVMPSQLVAFYARGNDVRDVVVDGRVLMEERRVLSVDRDHVLDTARQEAAKAFERVDITPYVTTSRQFWRGWRT